ncbi:hypothetical protein [Halomonas sp. SL1]|uniref:hypothetical protein n=1 Tax=Halomonas sp. SL1 TaxID=2137478 RepID=UPI0011B938AE|nr:hypothetical protein [Halomonas sp. SL1]
MTEDEWKLHYIRKGRLWAWVHRTIVLVAVVIPVLCYLAEANQWGGLLWNDWFKRSGGIMIALAILSELPGRRLQHAIDPPEVMANQNQQGAQVRYGWYLKIIHSITVVLGVGGTLIVTFA